MSSIPNWMLRRRGFQIPCSKPGPKAKPLEEKFWSKVNKTETCWLWTGYLDKNGYGSFTFGKHNATNCKKAYRMAWELINGPTEKGLHLHHTCRNRKCVNPAHLEPMPPSDHARISATERTRLSDGRWA